jgi:hypothetical protein
MANAVYNAYFDGILDGTIDGDGDTFHAVMVRDSGYTYSASHATMENSNVPTAARPASSVALTSVVVTGQKFDAADVTFSSVAAGAAIDAVIIFKYVTSETSASSIPCFYIDTTSDSSLPVTPNGGDITFTWNASGIVTFAGA